MLKTSFRAMIVVAVLAAPTVSFAAQFGPGAPAPDPIWKNGKFGPGAPAPDPIWKNGKFGPGAPAPDPIWKNGK